MKKRIIAIIVCLSFFIELFPHVMTNVNASSQDDFITVLSEGETVSDVMMNQDEKKVFTANSTLRQKDYQWQVLVDMNKDQWVDIHGQNESSMELHYAVVKNLLDQSRTAYIRCKVGKEDYSYSKPIAVTFRPHLENDKNMKPMVKKESMTFSNPLNEKAKTPEYVNVIVHYLGEDGHQLFNSYKGQIEYGTDFHQNIIIPTYLGFGAYINPDQLNTNDASTAKTRQYQLNLNFTALKEDQIVNVYYKPIDVPYGARYFFQNIHDDMYKEEANRFYQGKAKTGTIIDDATLNANAGDITGFTPLYHYPEAVAADGSTVFQVYYDRNYHLINFDMDGGYGTEPIYARYQTPFLVNEPSKTGYTFGGWDLLTTDSDHDGILDTGDGVADVLPNFIPARNLSYKAIWKRGQTAVTYVYWRENADDNGYSYWTSKQTTGLQSGDPVTFGDDIAATAPERQYFTYNAQKTEAENKDKIINGDGSTIVNVYYSRNKYKLRFYYARETKKKTPEVAGITNGFPKSTGSLNDKLTHRENSWYTANKIPQVKGYDVQTQNIGGYKYYYIEIEAKYNSDLSHQWPLRAIENVTITEALVFRKNAYFGAWTPENSTYYYQNNNEFGNNITVKGLYLRLDHRILHKNNPDNKVVNFLGFWAGHFQPSKWTYHIDIPKLDNSGYHEQASFVTYDTNTEFSEQTPTSVEGFTYDKDQSQFEKIGDDYHAHFRYKRNEYELNYFNYNDTLPNKENVPYNSSMKDKYFVPSYPQGLEKNAYEFVGWYTSPECVDGTEYDFSAEHMPAKNLTVYAKWVPVKHTVNFFQTKDDMLAYEANPNNDTRLHTHEVVHGTILGSVENPPILEGQKVEYTFGGWFHIENGQRTAYTPLDIPVSHDLNVYAEWGSKVAQPYKIHYVLKNDHSTQVAADTNGYAYQGSTRTFSCKVGNPYNQLYKDYNKGYFPTVASHSITMEYEEDKHNPAHNTFTFEYVKAESVEYRVRYVDAKTNQLLDEEKVVKTNNGIVTERFKSIVGYMPDAFYKRLSIAVVQDENGNYVGSPDNVITFYYQKADSTAFYAVHHMLQKPGTTGENMNTSNDEQGDYVESTTYYEGIANIDDVVGIKPTQFIGFKPRLQSIELIQQSKRVVDLVSNEYRIKIDKEGTELFIFYERETYPYKVQYKDFNKPESAPDLIPAKIVSGQDAKEYDTLVSELPQDIPGYAPISPDAKTIKIRAEEDENHIVNNVITFYYTELQYMAEYKVAGQGGNLSQGMETVNGDMAFYGSTPIPDEGYKFVGWFMDEACQVPVTNQGTIDKTTHHLIPLSEFMQPSPKKNTFYAKFAPMTGSLTITRKGHKDESQGDQVFVYRIGLDKGDASQYLDVTIVGNGSVTIDDLPIGDYQVSQMNHWSWRYKDAPQKIHISDDVHTQIEFYEPAFYNLWLNGHSLIHKNVEGGMNRCINENQNLSLLHYSWQLLSQQLHH